MSDLKTVCKKCGGEVTFPKEMRGEASSCPHCHEPIVLGCKTPAWVWAVGGVLIVCLCGVGVACFIFWSKQRSMPSAQQAGSRTVVSEPASSSQSSADDKEIAMLCQEYYDGFNERNPEKIRGLMTEACRLNIPLSETKDHVEEGGRYLFQGVNQVSYRTTPQGKAAVAQVTRTYNGTYGAGEGKREMFCLLEKGQWRLFRIQDWQHVITQVYFDNGFSPELHSQLESLRKNDPFTSWGSNDTNMLEEIFTDRGDTLQPFPWRVGFRLKSAATDDYSLKLQVAVSNKTTRTWPSIRFDLLLRQGGKKIGKTSVVAFKVGPNQEVESDERILFSADPLNGMECELDVFYHFQDQPIPFTQFPNALGKK